MTVRTVSFALAGLGWLALAAAVAWPVTALLVSTIAEGAGPRDGFVYSSRQMLLLWRSVWMSGVATIAAVALSMPAALLIGRSGRLSDSALIVTGMAAVLFCPPMIFAFGWNGVAPTSLNPAIRCIGVWALWAWPIAALILGTGWARTGRRSYEAALLSTGGLRAFVGVALPSLWRHVVLGSVVIFVLLVGEYSVPHACGLVVYATELLGWASSSVHTIDSAWPALPLVALVIFGVVAGRRLWSRAKEEPAVHPSPSTCPVGLSGLVGGLMAIAWIVPLAGQVRHSGGEALSAAVKVYGGDMLMSLGVAACGGLLVSCVGLVVAMSDRAGLCIALVTLAWGVMPGALTGDAMVAAYNRAGFALIYDHWPIVTLCYAARFAWIGALLGLIPRALVSSDLAGQARTDGASGGAFFSFVTFPLVFPALTCGFTIALAFGVSELPATTLVRVPDYSPIAHVLVEKFHRFEEGMLAALSLFLVVATVPALLVSLLVLRGRSPA